MSDFEVRTLGPCARTWVVWKCIYNSIENWHSLGQNLIVHKLGSSHQVCVFECECLSVSQGKESRQKASKQEIGEGGTHAAATCTVGQD